MTGLGKAIEARPFASLSSGLLARKGQAKPAMRPQGFGGFGNMTMGHEDLGWNDMGYDALPPQPAASEPEPDAREPRVVAAERFDGPVPPPPSVLMQRQTLADEFEEEEPDDAPTTSLLSVKPRARTVPAPDIVATPDTVPTPAVIVDEDRITPDVVKGRKAAFTLRLDAQRHLKLRLACAVGNRSAQQIVTAALDDYLNAITALDELADRVPCRSAS